MTTVAEFVERYLPELFARVREQAGGRGGVGVFGLNVIGAGAWSLAPSDTGLHVALGLSGDRALTASLAVADFEKLVLQNITNSEPPSSLLGERLLRWDSETVALIKAMPGSILVRIADQGDHLMVLLTPGSRAIDLPHAECTLDCEWNDLTSVRQGLQQPMELFLAGKLRIQGDAQLALALAGVLI